VHQRSLSLSSLTIEIYLTKSLSSLSGDFLCVFGDMWLCIGEFGDLLLVLCVGEFGDLLVVLCVG
jgi:hypothetical protein